MGEDPSHPVCPSVCRLFVFLLQNILTAACRYTCTLYFLSPPPPSLQRLLGSVYPLPSPPFAPPSPVTDEKETPFLEALTPIVVSLVESPNDITAGLINRPNWGVGED